MYRVTPWELQNWFVCFKFASRQISLTFHRGKALPEVSNPNFGAERERKADRRRAASGNTGYRWQDHEMGHDVLLHCHGDADRSLLDRRRDGWWAF